MKPVGDLFCSTKDNTNECIIDKRIIQSTIYKNCIDAQFKYFSSKQQEGNGSFRNLQLSVNDRMKLVYFINEVNENEIERYMNKTSMIRTGITAMRQNGKKYIDEILQGFNEVIKKDYVDKININTDISVMENKDDLFLKNATTSNLNSAEQFGKTQEEREINFDIKKLKFSKKLKENPTSADEIIYKIDRMKDDMIRMIKSSGIVMDTTKTPQKVPENPPTSYYKSKEFADVFEKTLMYLQKSLNGVKLSEQSRTILINIIMARSDTFRNIVENQIPIDPDFLIKLGNGNLDEAMKKLDHLVKNYKFDVKTGKAPNPIECEFEKNKPIAPMMKPKVDVFEKINKFKYNMTDDSSEYKHDWDPFNITCDQVTNTTISKKNSTNGSNFFLK
jgi:hypothetical protein